ncbi:ABC transporter ATP-binding protein [Roseobacteraceae bacterium S113]
MTETSQATSPKNRPRAGLFGWAWRRYLSKHWLTLAAAMVFMAIEGAMFGALSYMMKPMFDEVFVGGRQDLLVWVGLAFLAIFAARAFASIIQKLLLTRLSQRTVADIRNEMVRHLVTMEGQFHQTHSPGYLMQRIEGDVGSVQKVWNVIITGAGRDVVALVALFGVALAIDWRWTLIALIGVPLMVAPAVLAKRMIRDTSRKARDVAASTSVRLNEIFHGITPVKLNQLEGYQAKRYAELTAQRVRLAMKTAFGSASVPGMVDLMSGIGFMAVLFYGGSAILSGEKTVGDFMAFFTALGLAFEPLRRLGGLLGVWETAYVAIERIHELMVMQPAVQSPDNPMPRPTGTPAVTLRDVDMAYDDNPVLNGVSFVAEAGQTTALVGASGAGKSTIFAVITRLVDRNAGVIEVDGVDVSHLELHELRGLFSVVSQEALLFDETIRENIVLDQQDVSEAELQAALDGARVSEFLDRLPNGLDSPAGPRGSNLSGGQRQRVAIARAILRDRPVLLLDEATSALDTRSEALVQEALEQASEGRTTLVIAHRLSTIRNADKIIVMDAGRVIEQGTHDALLAKGGAYAELHAMQFSDDSAEPDPQDAPRPDTAAE